MAAVSVRHLISIDDLDTADVRWLVQRGGWYAAGHGRTERPLQGRAIGIYFRKTSTRTRTAFSRGALLLGAGIIAYGPDDLQ
ncbi:MAG: ornithine carbamoyltransferase, partial [Streptosporangiaceae bacterium]